MDAITGRVRGQRATGVILATMIGQSGASCDDDTCPIQPTAPDVGSQQPWGVAAESERHVEAQSTATQHGDPRDSAVLVTDCIPGVEKQQVERGTEPE